MERVLKGGMGAFVWMLYKFKFRMSYPTFKYMAKKCKDKYQLTQVKNVRLTTQRKGKGSEWGLGQDR